MSHVGRKVLDEEMLVGKQKRTEKKKEEKRAYIHRTRSRLGFHLEDLAQSEAFETATENWFGAIGLGRL